MRVLYFHQHFSTPDGATGTRSYEMARHMVSQGHHVTMVCGSYNVGQTGLNSPFIAGRREGIVDGIRVIEFDLAYANQQSLLSRAWQFIKFALRSIALALREPYDVLFATSTPLTAAIPGIVARWLRRKPFVFEVRDLWPELPKAMGVVSNPIVLSMLSALEWAGYRSSHTCIGLSPGIVDGIKGRARSSTPVHLIPNGCDLALFGTPAPAFDFGFGDDKFVACFTGAHGVANGLDILLDAAQQLKARGEERIVLLFIGEGREKTRLQQKAQAMGLDNCVFWDAMPKHRLVSVLQHADVGLMPLANVPAFYYGTSPNKFFDYIASGLPVLNNYPGWLADMINEHDCGVAVQPDDAAGIADGLQSLADDREACARMGKNGRQLAEQRFDRAALAEQFEQVLTGVASS